MPLSFEQFSPQIVLVLTAIAALGLTAGPAQAQVFQVTAKGTIIEVQNPDKLFDASVAVGVPFTCTETSDLSAPDTNAASAVSGQYVKNGAAYGVTITVGDYTIYPAPNSMNYLSVQPAQEGSSRYIESIGTQPEIVASSNHDAPVVMQAISDLSLIFREPGPITSKGMPPLSAYDMSRLDHGTMFVLAFFGKGDPNQYHDHVIGRLTSLTVTTPQTPSAPGQPVAATPAPANDTAAIRRQFEAKDAVIAALRRQVAALQAQVRKLRTASHGR